MPRTTIPIVTGETYHIYNRGVDKRVIFTDKKDYLRFYQSLNLFNSAKPIVNFDLANTRFKNKFEYEKLVEIQAYSLLPNHFHLIVKQLTDNGLGEFMRRVSSGYTSFFNKRNIRSGALFQGTFKRVCIESEEQYQYLFVYVNENHFVHDIQIEREICHSSSLHYQLLAKSKLIAAKTFPAYDFGENVQLAKEIFNRRQLSKVTFE